MATASLRIVYYGTPEFAVPMLHALHHAPDVEVAAAVTAPDKAAGRGQKPTASPVKAYALANGIAVLQPSNLKSPAFAEQLAALAPQLQVVVAFRMMPEAVWALPRLGTFNLHASLLPQYRGAAPIHWAVMNGETESGLTTFMLDRQIDTGGILLQTRIGIPTKADSGWLLNEMMAQGPELVLRTARGLRDGTLTPVPQPHDGPMRLAPKLFPEDGRICWAEWPGREIYNRIRGLSPFPTAWTLLDGKRLKLYAPLEWVFAAELFGAPGTARAAADGSLEVCAHDGILRLGDLQLEGKRRMPAADLLRGYTPDNWKLG